jgi:hypothetical protein
VSRARRQTVRDLVPNQAGYDALVTESQGSADDGASGHSQEEKTDAAGRKSDRRRPPAWCEGTLTRANEIETLACWAAGVVQSDREGWTPEACQTFRTSIDAHLAHARDATASRGRIFRRTGARLECAISSLDAAEADLLHLEPADYVADQMPNIVNHLCRHLQSTDPRRLEVERLGKHLGDAGLSPSQEPDRDADVQGRTGGASKADVRRVDRQAVINDRRGVIVSAVRGASSAALREQTRVRSFRDAVVATALGMSVVAIVLVVVGAVSPKTIPLCFAPQEANQVTVVCPTRQSGPIPDANNNPDVTATEINDEIGRTVRPADLLIVALIGVTAASVAAAAAIRKLRGSSEPYSVPIALAVLKLPTGAVTAILGLVLMRGGFVPGLSALDTSAQILAWAAIFGYAQQLFTRLVDQQAHAVLDGVRGGDKATAPRPSN